ncbi:MAG: hypothetical protein KDC98_01505 [Planctomycetes bacterium]|nr:hypothetical protein [Planctomycetota bacterium]
MICRQLLATSLLLLLLGSTAAAQGFVPLGGLTERVLAGAFDHARQIPIAVARGESIWIDTYELHADWVRRDGEGAMRLIDPTLWTDTVQRRVVAFGYEAGRSMPTGYAYDGVRWRPVTGDYLLAGYQGTATAFDSVRNEALAFGGSLGGLSSPDLVRWNGSSWSVASPAGPAPAPRSSAAFAFDRRRGRAVLFGGFDVGGSLLGDTWEWDGAAWTQPTMTAPPPRALAALAYDANAQNLVMFGGQLQLGMATGTWQYDGAQWTQLSPPVSPAPRFSPVLIEHPAGVLMVGGTMMSGGAETWNFAGGTWSRIYGDTAPGGRTSALMAYDSVRHEVVLHGGLRDLFSAWPQHDTWTFDGTWHHRLPTSQPSLRLRSAMVYDAANGECVMFGGGGPLADTWTWSGTGWSQRLPATSPSARSNHCMVYDSTQGAVVLFGGHDGTSPLGDTWRWNGLDWQNISGAVAPQPREVAFMAHDPGRGYSVLFGGVASQPLPPTTWLLAGSTWQQVTSTVMPQFTIGAQFDQRRGRVVALANFQEYSWDGAGWIVALVQNQIQLLGVGTASCADTDRGLILTFGGSEFYGNDRLLAYTSTPAVLTPFGTACAAAGVTPPDSFGQGRPALRTSDFAVGFRGPAAAPALTVFGLSNTPLSLPGGCTLQVGNVLGTVFGVADAAGFGAVGLPIPEYTGLRGVGLQVQTILLHNGQLMVAPRLGILLGD